MLPFVFQATQSCTEWGLGTSPSDSKLKNPCSGWHKRKQCKNSRKKVQSFVLFISDMITISWQIFTKISVDHRLHGSPATNPIPEPQHRDLQFVHWCPYQAQKSSPCWLQVHHTVSQQIHRQLKILKPEHDYVLIRKVILPTGTCCLFCT